MPDFPGRIAFHSDRDGDLDIYSMNADGTDVQRLTDTPGRDFEPAWSLDGSTIVFSSDRDDPTNAQLYLMDADGSNQRPLMPFSPADYVGALVARWGVDSLPQQHGSRWPPLVQHLQGAIRRQRA